MSTTTFTELFATTQLTASSAEIYTAPATAGTLVRNVKVKLTNTDAVNPVSVTLYNVPSGGSAGVTNAVLSAQTIPANDYIDVDLPDIPAGGSLYALASTASKVNISQIHGQIYNT